MTLKEAEKLQVGDIFKLYRYCDYDYTIFMVVSHVDMACLSVTVLFDECHVNPALKMELGSMSHVWYMDYAHMELIG